MASRGARYGNRAALTASRSRDSVAELAFRFGRKRLIESSSIRFPILAVAAAGSGLESTPVENRDIAATVVNQISLLQRTCRIGTHAEHEGQELLRDMKRVSVCTILGHEQPPGEACLYHMEARASRRPGKLAQSEEDIATDLVLQRMAASKFTAKGQGANSQCRSRPLYDREHGRHVHAERDRNPEHSFVSNEAHLERRTIIDRHDQ